MISNLLKTIFIFFLVQQSSAMQCTELPFAEKLKKADIIFSGKVISREIIKEETRASICSAYSEASPDCGPKIAKFKIIKVWKGNNTDSEIKVYSKDACSCLGSYFRQDKEYLVFARYNEDLKLKYYLANDPCSGTKLLNLAKEDGLLQQLDTKKH